VASYLTSPHTRTASMGASAAVFGLFMVGVLTKFQPSLRRLLEALILGQFVLRQVLNVSRHALGHCGCPFCKRRGTAVCMAAPAHGRWLRPGSHAACWWGTNVLCTPGMH
jgi:hypothetical protein